MIIKELGRKPTKLSRADVKSQLTGNQVDCSYCNSVYLIEPKDIKFKWEFNGLYYSDRLYVKCYLCKKHLPIPNTTQEQRNAFIRWWHKLLPLGGL